MAAIAATPTAARPAATVPASRPAAQGGPAVVPPVAKAPATDPVIHEFDPAQRDLADERVADRVAAALGAEAVRDLARGVHFAVTDGTVRLFGVARNRDAVRQTEAAVRADARISAVQNDLHILGARWDY